jgi:protein-tyrosine phosphatase
MRTSAAKPLGAALTSTTMFGTGFIDLHCHWIANIDDGVRIPEAGVALLRGLERAGFSTVVATPHMRPGMFDNDGASLSRAFDAMRAPLDAARAEGRMPEVHLSSEHFFDDVVYERIRRGEALPYPSFALPPAPPKPGAWPGAVKHAKRGILVEFPSERFPMNVANRFFDLHRAGYQPVLAHPERYAPVWKNSAALEPIVEAGVYLLLDVCSLVGKYGRAARKASEKLLEDGAYTAACSDAHKPEDVEIVEQAIARLRELAGDEGVSELLSSGPRRILNIPDAV